MVLFFVFYLFCAYICCGNWNLEMEKKHITYKIRSGHYIYRGIRIDKVDYDKSWWEATDLDGTGFAQAGSLRYVKSEIDEWHEKGVFPPERCPSCVHYESAIDGKTYCPRCRCRLTGDDSVCKFFEYVLKNSL